MSVAFDSNVSITVEAGIGNNPFDTSITWTDISSYLRSFSTSRGRSAVNAEYSTGTGTLTLNNSDGRFHPSSTTYSPNSFTIGTPIRIRATYSAVTYDIFRGHVERTVQQYPGGGHDEIAVVTIVEDGKILNLARLSGAESSERTDLRIGNILDQAGWPVGRRSLDTGLASVQALESASGVGALDHIRRAARSEVGAFFVAANGDATFKNRTSLSGASWAGADSLGTSDHQPGPSVSWDDDFLWNKSQITRQGGTIQEAEDPTSVTAYGPRTLSRSGELMTSDNEALNVAEWEVLRYAEPRLRPEGLRFRPQSDPSTLWPILLGNDLRDPIVYTLTGTSGVATSANMLLEQVSHTVDASSRTWDVGVTLLPVPTAETDSYWVLGTSTLGVSTVLA